MQPQALLFLLALAACATTSTSAYQHRRSLLDSSPATCRLETGCENQPCSATAYEYDAASAGIEFPYTVSYTTTADATTTSFVFLVCSQANSLGGCTEGSDPGCSPLATFQLRTRDDMLSQGDAPAADPPGTPWDSCNPQGPGYKWEGPALGNLSTQQAPSANNTCQTFTLMTGVNAGGQAATLSEMCQQNITVVDTKDNSTVVDSSPYDNSCLYTMTLDSGRTAYGLLGTPIPLYTAVPGRKIPVDIGRPSGGPTPYGPGQYFSVRRRGGPTPYGRRTQSAHSWLVVDGRRVGRLF